MVNTKANFVDAVSPKRNHERSLVLASNMLQTKTRSHGSDVNVSMLRNLSTSKEIKQYVRNEEKRRKAFTRDAPKEYHSSTIELEDDDSPGPHARRLIEREAMRRERRKKGARHARMMRRIKASSSSFVESLSPYIETESKEIKGDFLSALTEGLNVLNPLGKHPALVELFGPWLAMIYQLCRSDNVLDAWVAVYQYGRTTQFKDIFSQSNKMEIFESLFPDLEPLTLIDKFNSQFTDEIKTESLASGLTTIRSVLSSIICGDFAQVICGLLMASAQTKFISKESKTKISDWIGRMPKMTWMEMINYCFNQVLILCRMADDWWAGKDIKTVLGGKNSVWLLIEESYTQLHFKDKLYTGLPVQGCKEASAYLIEIANLLTRLKKAKSVISPVSSFKVEISKCILQLEQVVYDTRQLVNSKSRDMPFCIMIHGDPGIGKSKLIDLFLSTHCKTVGRKFTKDLVYHRTMHQQFWEGYNPDSHPYIHLSELGNTHRNIASNRGDEATLEFCSLADTQSMAVPMAFGEKGKNYARPEVVIADCNDPRINADVVVNNSSAVERRWLYIHPHVKPQYCVPGGTALDVAKSLADPDPFDRWEIDVYVRVPSSLTKSTKRLLLNRADIYTTLQFVYAAMTKHQAAQRKVRSFTCDPSQYLGMTCDPCCPFHCNPFKPPDALCSRMCSQHCGNHYKGPGGDPPDDGDDRKDDSGNGNPHQDHPDESKEPPGYIDPVKISQYWESEPEAPYNMQDDTDPVRRSLKMGIALAEEATLKAKLDICSLMEDFSVKYKKFSSMTEMFNSFEIPIISSESKFLDSLKRKLPLGKSALRNRMSELGVQPAPPPPVIFNSENFTFYEKCVLKKQQFYHGYLEKKPYVINWVCGVPQTLWRALGGIIIIILLLLLLLGVHLPWGQEAVVAWFKGEIEKKIRRTWGNVLDTLCLRECDPFESDYWKENKEWLKPLGLTVIALGVCFSIFGFSKKSRRQPRRKHPLTLGEDGDTDEEGCPHFQPEAYERPNDDLSRLEDLSGCGRSYRRIPLKHSMLWNTQVVFDKPGLFSGESEKLDSVINRNVRKCKIVTNCTFGTYLLGLRSNIALINTHALGTNDEVLIRVSMTGKIDDSNVIYKDSYIDRKSRLDLGNDKTLILLSDVFFVDILHHFGDSYQLNEYCGFLDKGKRQVRRMKGPIDVKDQYVPTIVDWMWRYSYPEHSKGKCGIPLTIDVKGSVIAGIHSAGGGLDGFATPVFKQELIDGCKRLEELCELMPYASDGLQFESTLMPPHKKSPFSHILLQGVEYFGSEKWNHSHQYSRVKKTFIHDEVEEMMEETYGVKPTTYFGKPMMRPTSVNGEYISPYNIALSGISRQRKGLNRKTMRKVVDIISERFMQALKGRTLSPLDIDTACNGSDLDPYLRAINLATSAGYGHPGKKEDYFTRDEDGRRIPSPELRAEIAKRIESYSKGICPGTVFNACLKDEARSVEKCKSGKTRLFYIAELATLIVCKMYLAPFYTLMVEMNELFCSSVGINMYSGADALRKRMAEFSRFIMEADFKEFDLSAPPDITWGVNSIIFRVLKAGGYNDVACIILAAILTEKMFPLVMLLGDLFRVCGIQPSGMYGTAEDNCVRVLCLLVYCWVTLFPGDDFFTYVLPSTYGDDLIAAIAALFKDRFNNNVFKDFCREHFAMILTPSDKSPVMRDFVTLEEMSFLKRTFKFLEERNRWVAPLDINSVFRCLMWTVPKSSSEYEQFKGAAVNTMWELALHGSDRQHETIRLWLTSRIQERFGCTVDLPSRQTILSRMFDNEHHSSDKGGPEEQNPPPVMIVSESSSGEFTLNALQGKAVIGVSAPLNRSSTRYGPFAVERVDPDFEIHTESIEFLDKHRDSLLPRRLELEQELKEYSSLGEMTPKQVRKQMATASYRERQTLKRYLDIITEIEAIRQTITQYNILMIESECETCTECYCSIFSESEEITQNLSDVMGAPPDIQHAGDTSVQDAGQTNLLNLGDFLSRPVQIYSGTVAVGSNVGVRLSVWDLFTLEPSVRAKLRNYAYLNSDLHVRVVVSGSPFHYGRILASYQPYADWNSNITRHLAALTTSGWRPLFLNYLSQARGAATIDVKANKPLEIVCPFISPKPMHRLFNNSALALAAGTSYQDLEVAGDLFLYSFDPIGAVSSTPTPIYIQVFAWMEDVKLGTSTATQIVITTESEELDERKQGPVERAASRMASTSRALQLIPEIGFYAKASEILFNGVSSLAAHFGWSKPVMNEHTVKVKPEPFENGALTIGTDTVKRIVLDPRQELTVDPRCVGISHDDMTMSALCAIPSYYQTITWDDSSPVLGTPIHIAKVTPCLGSSTTATKLFVQPTAMAFAAAPFVYWRGDVTFRFEIVCSAFHRGKLAVFYEPNLSQVALLAASFDLNKQYLKLIDIQETNVFEVTVEWASARSWLYTSTPVNVANNTGSVTTTGVSTSNGFIALCPFTQLQSPDGSPVSINMYAYSKNMHFNHMSRIHMPSERDVPTVGMAMEIETESELLPGTSIPEEVACFTLNKSTANMNGISQDYFGEEPISFRALLKRYVSNRAISYNADASTSVGLMLADATITPFNNLVYDAASAASFTDLYSYLKYAYLGWRGSVRYRIHYATNITGGVGRHLKVTRHVPRTSTTTEGASWFASTSPAKSQLDGTVTYVPSSFAGYEVELPFYSSNLFFISFGESDIYGASENIMSDYYTRSFEFHLETTGPIVAGGIGLEFATGEDFSFLRFSGAPFYSVVV